MDLKVCAKRIEGVLSAPPSKSYAIRYIIAAFLSGDETTVFGVGNADDVLHCIDCVKNLGAELIYDGNDVRFTGKKTVAFAVLNCGESATLYRLLLPIVCALGVETKFVLSDSLKKRPCEGLITCLNAHGAKTDGFTVEGKLFTGEYVIDTNITSQYASGLLLALPLVGDCALKLKGKGVSKSYIEMTENVLTTFGVNVDKKGSTYYFGGVTRYSSPSLIRVGGDWSGAVTFLALGAVAGNVRINNLAIEDFQSQSQILSALKSFGVDVSFSDGAVIVARSNLKRATVDCTDMPDLAPVLAGLAAVSDGVSVIKNVARLKYKESDRVAEIIKALQACGATCSFDGNNLTIMGGKLNCAYFAKTFDHRIAMLETFLAVASGEECVICGAECVSKSYKDFFEHFKQIGGCADVVV